MAKYTIELRTLCDLYGRNEIESWFKNYCIYDYLTEKQVEVINKSGLWNKDKLARKIVNHFFTREIGSETPALFQKRVEYVMDELMEEKLPLIYSNCIEYDPLVNVDFTETFERNQNSNSSNTANDTSSSTSNSSSTNNSTGIAINSDTPQGQISKTQILDGTYASSTSGTQSDSSISDTSTTSANANSTNTGTNSSVEDYTKKVKGNSGVSATAQKMIEQYRQNIVGINKEIMNEIDKLFIGLY